jgi:transposase InsO family protein
MANVSKSGYYKWLGRKEQTAKDHEDYLLIKEIFDKGKKKLGWRSVQMRLKNDYKITMNHKKIRRIMSKYGLCCQARRKNPYKAIMKKTQEHRTFENILSREFKQSLPKKALCTDITYLYFSLGRKAYLSAIKDIATGEILSWEISINIDLEFVLKTVGRLENLKLPPDALIHSDQGFHYTNPLYIAKIKQLNIIQSMSRKGSCIDNAPMESFFGHLKDELEFKNCSTFQELTVKVTEYMQYYNHHRYQWGLKKMTPAQYRDHLLAASAA